MALNGFMEFFQKGKVRLPLLFVMFAWRLILHRVEVETELITFETKNALIYPHQGHKALVMCVEIFPYKNFHVGEKCNNFFAFC